MSKSGPQAGANPLEDLARWTPCFIAAYFILQFIIRLFLSPHLETDEAQFAGQTYLALGYPNSHPPLYNWLVAAALRLTGGHWPAAVALVKNLLLAGTYFLAFDLARRITGRALTGLIIVASLLFLPQIVWKSQITLAHSVMVMFAVIAVMHAIVLIVQRGDIWSFAWLGLAASIGAFAKYNFFLSLAAAVAAAFSVPAIRARLASPKLAVSCAILAATFTPHLFWALNHWGETTQRLAKLERKNRLFAAIDLPYIGLDGVLSALLGFLAWAGPLILVWLIIYRITKPPAAPPANDAMTAAFGRFSGRAAAFGFTAFLLILAAADLHHVHERYLTAVLMPLPFWLAFTWPLEGRERAAAHFIRTAAAAAFLMLTAAPLVLRASNGELDATYAAASPHLRKLAHGQGQVAFYSVEQKYAANFALQLENAAVWSKAGQPQKVLVLWPGRQGRSDKAPERAVQEIGPGYEPGGPPVFIQLDPDPGGSWRTMGAQLYVRRP